MLKRQSLFRQDVRIVDSLSLVDYAKMDKYKLASICER